MLLDLTGRLIGIFRYIIASVTDVFFDIGSTVIGSQCRIHDRPAFSVKFNNIVHPANFRYIATDPCVVDIAGVADIQFGWNPLRAEHCRHQGCIVKADSRAGGKGVIRNRDITIRNRCGFFLIVSDIFDDIVINICDGIQICITTLCQYFSLFDAGRIRIEIYIKIRV